VLVAMSHHAKHSMLLSPKVLVPVALPSTEKPPGVTVGGSGTF
jgi:hypothetical protein